MEQEASPFEAPSQGEAADKQEQALSGVPKVFRFRSPEDPLLVCLNYKIFALTEVSSTQQTFTARISEEKAIWISEEECNDYFNNDRRTFEPKYFVETFAYNGTNVDWEDYLQTPDRCKYHVRRIRGHDNRCFAWCKRLSSHTFNEPFELNNFPFDVQDLTMVFQLHTYMSDYNLQVEVRPMYDGAGYSSQFVEPRGEYKVFRQVASFRNDGKNRVICSFQIRRQWTFYFWKVMLVLGVISLTAVLAFVSFDDGFMDQAAHLSTVLLTDVAYLYIVSAHVPTLRYLTLMDIYILSNIGFVLLIFAQITTLSLYQQSFSEEWTSKLVGSNTKLTVGNLFLILNTFLWFLGNATFGIVSYRAYCWESMKLRIPPADEDGIENATDARREDEDGQNTSNRGRGAPKE